MSVNMVLENAEILPLCLRPWAAGYWLGRGYQGCVNKEFTPLSILCWAAAIGQAGFCCEHPWWAGLLLWYIPSQRFRRTSPACLHVPAWSVYSQLWWWTVFCPVLDMLLLVSLDGLVSLEGNVWKGLCEMMCIYSGSLTYYAVVVW